MKRSAGVLLNISSLPGEFGIGGFSTDALNFIEYITSMGFHWWQILPLTTIGKGNSPYSGISAFAGNSLYLDPYSFEKGLLTEDEIISSKFSGGIYLTYYDYARKIKKQLLQKAFSRLTPLTKSNIECFRKVHAYWLEDYALFMALRDMFENKPWYEWEDKYKFRDKTALDRARNMLEDKILYYCFEQYEFFRQWKTIKEYAHKCGVGIFGDMPIYVMYDSVDVWAHPELFQLNKNLKPELIAGVPPDYFTKDGQLWGNPLYNYKNMQKDNYVWFIKRIEHNLKLYDKLRIDHFRGFYKYWAVDAAAKNAKEGQWLDGPKMEIWEKLKQKIKNPDIVAEDLGIINEDVHNYVKQNKFRCMRVMQFAFDHDPANIHLPHNYYKDCVGYTSTHDNDTTLGWLLTLDEHTRSYALNYVNCQNISGWAAGGGDCPSTKAFIRSLISSSCDIAIIPMQDLCGYGGDTRMNTPGIAEGNWEYRANYTAMENVDRNYMLMLNNLYARNCPITNRLCSSS